MGQEDLLEKETATTLVLSLNAAFNISANLEKTHSGCRPEKRQFSLYSQRRVMPKVIHTNEQLHSFHMLAGLCLQSFKLGFRIILIKTSRCTSWHSKRQRNQR